MGLQNPTSCIAPNHGGSLLVIDFTYLQRKIRKSMFGDTFVAYSEKGRELFLQSCELVVLYFALVGLVCIIYEV